MFSVFKKGLKRSIILDIQSGLVRGALVESAKGEPSRIITIITKSISNSIVPINTPRIIQKILEVAVVVVENIIKESGHHNIHHIHYILSSPWIYSELKTTKVDYDVNTKITKSMIDSIVGDEIKKISSMEDTEPIEQSVFEIKLNGYAVSSYKDKNAKTLQIALSTSYGSKKFLDGLNSSIQKVIQLSHYSYHSAILMQYKAFHFISNNRHEYIYMHVHGELTDIIIVKNGLCKHISSFPFGIITLLREISHVRHAGMEESESFLALYDGNKLDESERQNAKKIIDPLLNAWSALCIKSFESTFDVMHIPRTVFLSAHSHFNLFKESLLFRNDLNFDVIPYEKMIEENSLVTFEKGSPHSVLMKMYTLVLDLMI